MSRAQSGRESLRAGANTQAQAWGGVGGRKPEVDGYTCASIIPQWKVLPFCAIPP